MIATGFLRLGPEAGGGERGRQDSLDDVVADDDADVHGGDGRVRALPQPQVRSDSAEGLLPDPGRLLLDARRRHPLVPAHEVAAHRAETSRIDGRAEAAAAGEDGHRGAVPEAARRRARSRCCPSTCRRRGTRRPRSAPRGSGSTSRRSRRRCRAIRCARRSPRSTSSR